MARAEWRPVPGYEGYYEVSDQGEVRSVTRTVLHGRHGITTYQGRPLKLSFPKCGYAQVSLTKGVRIEKAYVHHLVLLAFVGSRPVTEERGEIRHLNGNKRDNRLSNIVYGTVRENAADRRLHAQQRRSA